MICFICVTLLQLESEKSIKNATEWALSQYYANYSSFYNTTDVPPPDVPPADVIRGPCWETAVGIVSQFLFLPHIYLHSITPSRVDVTGLFRVEPTCFTNVFCHSGVCEADRVGHSGDVFNHPGGGLCPSGHCSLPELLLVLGPGGWICEFGQCVSVVVMFILKTTCSDSI